MHQTADVLPSNRQVAEYLQNTHGLGDVLVDWRVAETSFTNAVDCLVDASESALDILLQGVVEGHGGSEPTYWLIGNRRLTRTWLDQHILDHLDCRAQADATRRAR